MVGRAMMWAAVALTGVLGCTSKGPPRVSVHGSILNKGHVLTVKPMVGRVQVTFIPVVPAGSPPRDPQEAVVKPDGTFTVPGTDNRGVPVGKYKVAIRQWDEFPNKDTLQGAYAPDKTPLVVEVDGKTPLDIDLGAPVILEQKP